MGEGSLLQVAKIKVKKRGGKMKRNFFIKRFKKVVGRAEKGNQLLHKSMHFIRKKIAVKYAIYWIGKLR